MGPQRSGRASHQRCVQQQHRRRCEPHRRTPSHRPGLSGRPSIGDSRPAAPPRLCPDSLSICTLWLLVAWSGAVELSQQSLPRGAGTGVARRAPSHCRQRSGPGGAGNSAASTVQLSSVWRRLQSYASCGAAVSAAQAPHWRSVRASARASAAAGGQRQWPRLAVPRRPASHGAPRREIEREKSGYWIYVYNSVYSYRERGCIYTARAARTGAAARGLRGHLSRERLPQHC